jgi:hypothetical protein
VDDRYRYVTPKLIHFIWLTDSLSFELPLIAYIALKSAHKVNPSYQLLLHTNSLPSGALWERARHFVTLISKPLDTEIVNQNIHRVEHKSDVMRLNLMLQFGGVYLDLDTICLRPFDAFLTDKVVMGRESPSGLCNAVIISPPNSPFVQLWRERYKDFHNNQWNEFSVQLPNTLASEHGDLINVQSVEVFFEPTFSEKSLEDLFVNVKPFPNAHIFHLWNKLSKEFTSGITARSLRDTDSTYSLAARQVLDGEIEVLIQEEESHPNGAAKSGVEGLNDFEKERTVFTKIYATSGWGKGSGNGSNPECTVEYRSFLERFIVMNAVTSVIDIGCGDWQSSRYINFNNAHYIGFDLVDAVVEQNNKIFGSKDRKVEFRKMPIDPSDLPVAQLLIMKDVLQHMTDRQIAFYRDKVFPKYPLCLITNSWQAINYLHNVEISAGAFRTLDLRVKPYLFKGAYVNEIWNQWERIRTMGLIN